MTDKTADYNQKLARRASTVIAAVFARPSSWARVRDIVGPILTPVKGYVPADAFARTAWRALTKVMEKHPDGDSTAVREDMVSLVEAQPDPPRIEWLSVWGKAEQKLFHWLLYSAETIETDQQAVAAAQRLKGTFANEQLSIVMIRNARELKDDPLAEPHAMTDALLEHVRTNCVSTAAITVNNAGGIFQAMFASQAAKVIPTGFSEIDKANAGGADIAQLTLLCLATGGGKSLILQAIARNQVWPASAKYKIEMPARAVVNTDHDRPYVLMLSVENTSEMLAERSAADMLGIPAYLFRDPAKKAEALGELELKDLVTANELVEGINAYGRLSCVDTSDMNDSASILKVSTLINAWCDAVTAETPEARMLVLVDYLQDITPSDEQSRDTRTQQIEKAAGALKDIAKKRNVAVIAACMLNDTRDNVEPGRGDNRDSRGPNGKAANVWIGHSWSNKQRTNLRESDQSMDVIGAIQIFSDKARSAQPGWLVPLHMQGDFTRITDAADPKTLWLRDADAKAAANGESVDPFPDGGSESIE